MSDKPALVVMAAGMGSRYGGLKQTDPVGPNGQIILEYSVYDALKAGFGKFVIILKEEMEEDFREKIGRKLERYAKIAYVFQSVGDLPAGYAVPSGRIKPWGTAHAVLTASSAVEANFAVINADDYYGANSFRILCDYLKDMRDNPASGTCNYCMTGFIVENTLTEHGHVARGVCVTDEMDNLSGINERIMIRKSGGGAGYSEDGGKTWTAIPAGSIVSMNMWGFTHGFFGELRARFPKFLEAARDRLEKAEYFLPDVVNQLIEEKRAAVRVLRTGNRWFGVTYREDKEIVKDAILKLTENGVYTHNLWE